MRYGDCRGEKPAAGGLCCRCQVLWGNMWSDWPVWRVEGWLLEGYSPSQSEERKRWPNLRGRWWRWRGERGLSGRLSGCK